VTSSTPPSPRHLPSTWRISLTLFVPFFAAKRAPRSLPEALRRPKLSSRRPHLRLEAIEDSDHTFELAVLFCIPS
jgi:hypothetical protein